MIFIYTPKFGLPEGGFLNVCFVLLGDMFPYFFAFLVGFWGVDFVVENWTFVIHNVVTLEIKSLSFPCFFFFICLFLIVEGYSSPFV